MTRKSERICYLLLLVLLGGFLAYDWYERIFIPSRSNSQSSSHSLQTPEETLTASSQSQDTGNDPNQNGDRSDKSPEPRLLEWPLEVPDEFHEEFVSEESYNDDVENAWMYEPTAPTEREKISEREIDEFYSDLARKKSHPASHRRIVDWEATAGEKPDWVVGEEWRARLRMENYLNPGPIYTTSYTDVYGNRHRSFEDRSGRVDVFNTWGRKYIYGQPK